MRHHHRENTDCRHSADDNGAAFLRYVSFMHTHTHKNQHTFADLTQAGKGRGAGDAAAAMMTYRCSGGQGEAREDRVEHSARTSFELTPSDLRTHVALNELLDQIVMATAALSFPSTCPPSFMIIHKSSNHQK
jgi:hypothetical protein